MKTYIWLDMKTWVLDLIYHSLQVHSFAFSLYFSTLSFKTLSLRSKVGMRPKALYNKCSVAEIFELFHIITKEKYIHYFACDLNFHWAQEQNLAHVWIVMVLMKPDLKILWFLVGNKTVLAKQTFLIRFSN